MLFNTLSLLLLFLATFALLAFASFAVCFEGLLEILKDFLVGDTGRDLDLLYMCCAKCRVSFSE
jgi:hypothetical protein